MKKQIKWLSALCLLALLATPVQAALPSGTGIITNSSHVSGSEFSSKSSIAKKLNKMFAGDIGLYANSAKTKLVNAALGTRSVPNNNKYQYWGSRAGTSCFAYANAFYGSFYDGTYPHGSLNGNHKKVTVTGKITYENFVKWGVRSDAAVYIREGNHSVVVLHYDENYITYVDGNGDGKGLVALRKEAWKRGSGTNIYNSKPSLIVQPKESYFAAGSMGKKQPLSCTKGGTSHDWDEGAVTQSPTCKDKGVRTYTCLDCGKTKESTLAKTSDHTYGAYTVTREATCTKKGEKAAVCTLCGKEKTKTTKALGHDYGKSVTIKEASIYAQGVREKTCTRCEKTTQIKTPCMFREGDVTLTAEAGAFPKNTKILTDPEEAGYAEILQEITGKSRLYTLVAEAKDIPVQPEKPVTLELTVPEGFSENLLLCLVTSDGTQVLESTLEDGVLTARVETMGTFALCDLDVPYVPPTTQTQPPVTQPTTQPAVQPVTTQAPAPRAQLPEKSHILLLGLAATVAAALLTGAVAFILIRKRRKAKQDAPINT